MTATLLQKIENPNNRKPLANKLLRGYIHKTSNSLCGIKGYASLIIANDTTSDGSYRWAKKILDEIERMEEIFRSVGDLTQRGEPFRSGCDIPGVLDRSIKSTGNDQSNTQFQKGELPAGQLLLPEADLQLVLKEILQNCVDSAPDVKIRISGQVEITGRVVLIITDDGPGMSPELLKMATDPFVTTRVGHHGVGLTRIETILDMHNLAWSLTSRPGKGTSVTLEVAESIVLNPEFV
mgnify:CR=1 FL=1